MVVLFALQCLMLLLLDTLPIGLVFHLPLWKINSPDATYNIKCYNKRIHFVLNFYNLFR